MSTSFLHGFAQVVVSRLTQANLLDCAPGEQSHVIDYVARALAQAGQNRSLISSLERALLECPAVIELYADFDQIKQIIDELAVSPAH